MSLAVKIPLHTLNCNLDIRYCRAKNQDSSVPAVTAPRDDLSKKVLDESGSPEQSIVVKSQRGRSHSERSQYTARKVVAGLDGETDEDKCKQVPEDMPVSGDTLPCGQVVKIDTNAGRKNPPSWES